MASHTGWFKKISKAMEVTDKKLTVAELHIIVKNLQQDYVTVVTALADTVMELKAKVMELENANNSTLSHEALQKAVTDEVEAAVDSKCTSLKDELREDRDKKIEEEVKTHTVLNEEAIVDKVAGKVQASWADFYIQRAAEIDIRYSESRQIRILNAIHTCITFTKDSTIICLLPKN